jgi:hypothetical protein
MVGILAPEGKDVVCDLGEARFGSAGQYAVFGAPSWISKRE